MPSARRIPGPSGPIELTPAQKQAFEAAADDLLWLGYEAAFPAAWMTEHLACDEAHVVT